MYIVCVNIWVKEGLAEKFISVTLENCRGTKKEEGNVRFDFLQCEDDPHRFFLYEVYKTKDDFKKHQQTEHYIKWREGVEEMMAQPRQGVKYGNIFPDDKNW